MDYEHNRGHEYYYVYKKIFILSLEHSTKFLSPFEGKHNPFAIIQS